MKSGIKPVAKLGYLAAACALLVAAFSIIGPRAVHAAVATLVQVANTAASPIPTVATDNPALQPFAVSATSTGVDLGFSAPAGKTWSIETISIFCNGRSGTVSPANVTDIRLFLVTGGVSLQYTFAPTVVTANTELIVTEPIRAYADPGSFVQIGSGAGVPSGWSCYGVLSGHLVNPI
jgi:hypothetical protein